MLFHPAILSGFAQLQTDPGDTRFNHYILEHGYRWVRGDAFHSSLWDPPFFYPEKNILAYSDTLLGVAPVYWVLRATGLTETSSFQGWAMLIAFLNFGAAYWLFRKGLRLGSLGSLAAAFLFAFSAVRTNQLGHHQLQGHFYTPLFLFCLVRMFDVKAAARYPYAAAAWVLATLQLYASFYLGWFLVFGLSAALGVSLVLSETRHQVRHVIVAHRKGLLVGLGVSAMLVFPMASRYYQVALETGYWRLRAVFHPPPQAWIYLGPDSWLFSWQADLVLFESMTAEHEQQLGLGLATAVAVLLGFWWNRHNRLAQIVFITAAALVLVATSTLLWRPIYWFFPGAAALRALPRLALILLLPAGLGLAWCFERLTQSFRQGDRISARGHLWIVIAGAVVLLEQGVTTPSFDWKEVQARAQKLQARIDPNCRAFLILPDPADHPGRPLPINVIAQQDAMWASLWAGVPTVNGRSGKRPPRWRLNVERPDRYDSDVQRWKQRWPELEGQVCYVGYAPPEN